MKAKRILIKIFLLLFLVILMLFYEKAIYPVISAQTAVYQLADTVGSSTGMILCDWTLPAGWIAIVVIAMLLIAGEVKLSKNDNKERDE